jgi:hypothetical protein
MFSLVLEDMKDNNLDGIFQQTYLQIILFLTVGGVPC